MRERAFFEVFVAVNTNIIDEKGIFPPQALSLNDTGKLTVMALALAGPEAPTLTYLHLARHLLQDKPRELVFGLDRYSKPEQGTTLADCLSVQHWDGQRWHLGIMEYQHAPRVVKPIDFENTFWRDRLLGEMRQFFAPPPYLPRDRMPPWARALLR